LNDSLEEHIRAAVFQLVATYANKRSDDVKSLLAEYLPQFWMTEIASATRDVKHRSAALRGYIWILRGLLARNHPDVNQGIERLFTIFDDPQLSWDAARGIGELAKGGEDILVKDNFCIIRRLYVQKFVSMILPKLLHGCKATHGTQLPYIIGLASLVSAIPKAMYLHSLASILPLLLRAMDLPDEPIRAHAVDTIHAVASDESSMQTELIEEYAYTIVNALLQNSDAQRTKSSQLRCSSLRCIGILPSTVKYSVLHPYKQKVVSQLGRFIDDPKRRVRKEAVDARSNWLAYSA